jgi:hypothetical protein
MKSIISHLAGSVALITVLFMSSCKKEKEETPSNSSGNGIRTSIDYNSLTATTPYKNLFLDKAGDTVVDLSAGNTRYRMFQALNYYLGSAVRDSKVLDSNQMKNMFSNTGSPFVDVTSLNIKGSVLNASPLQLRNILSLSVPMDAEKNRQRVEHLLGDMARLSVFFADTAAKGKPGKIGTYLADARGVEVAQIIQKSLIGAAQLDYISNILLNIGLNADNKTIVSGKKYTQLEQNWDEAYGFLTLNPVYLMGSTDATRGTAESFLGSYIWEYNKSAYAKIYPAFLKGRAAIANNDIAEVKVQAALIREAMEKAIANAAVGYLGKWKTGTTDAARVHAIGEGLGFIYSLRFCHLNGADAAFSDGILNKLMDSPDGYWDFTTTKINEASTAISSKFKL